MAKTLKLKIEYRAKCRDCREISEWTEIESEAETAAAEHQDNEEDHVVDIEKKYSRHSARKFTR